MQSGSPVTPVSPICHGMYPRLNPFSQARSKSCIKLAPLNILRSYLLLLWTTNIIPHVQICSTYTGSCPQPEPGSSMRGEDHVLAFLPSLMVQQLPRDDDHDNLVKYVATERGIQGRIQSHVFSCQSLPSLSCNNLESFL